MRTLIIGYGNPSRRDDGVALVVINGLRQRLGLPSLEGNDDGWRDVGREVDTLFLQQLMPELVETLVAYERVVFVDAHVGVYPEPIRRIELAPNPARALVSHHVKPEGLLELSQRLYGCAPSGELISVRGFDFDFGAELSEETAGAAEAVVEEIWASIMAGSGR
jgi:hydrogenase maturation protease